MIEIQLQSPVPIYEQLVQALRKKILGGELREGSKLPPIRSLAAQLDVAVNTVARAYQELERQQLIVSNGRKGSFVRLPQNGDEGEDDRVLKAAILGLLKKGYEKEDIERMFMDKLHQIFH